MTARKKTGIPANHTSTAGQGLGDFQHPASSNLLRATDGRYVFLVEAEPPEPVERERSSTRPSSTSRRPRPKERRPVQVEYR